VQTLIIELVREVFEGRQRGDTTHVITLDGLDECSEESSLDDLIIGRGNHWVRCS